MQLGKRRLQALRRNFGDEVLHRARLFRHLALDGVREEAEASDLGVERLTLVIHRSEEV